MIETQGVAVDFELTPNNRPHTTSCCRSVRAKPIRVWLHWKATRGPAKLRWWA